MGQVWLVFLGGGLGAVARYLATSAAASRWSSLFPMGTFLVNLSGSFLLGILFGVGMGFHIKPGWRMFLATGFLGGYTTFSSWQLESFVLAQDGHLGLAVVNLGASLVLGVCALVLGVALGSRFVSV